VGRSRRLEGAPAGRGATRLVKLRGKNGDIGVTTVSAKRGRAAEETRYSPFLGEAGVPLAPHGVRAQHPFG
jgi:hypothetical protein